LKYPKICSRISKSQTQTKSENDLTDRELGQVSCSQAKQFLKPDGTLDYDKGYQEVLRRTKGCPNFNCSKERFISLCSENADVGPKGMREAITGLQLEAQGKIFNLRRGPEQVDIGSDFLAEDINGVTRRIEIKSPVGSAIKAGEGDDPWVEKQGKSIGMKISKQIRQWMGNDKITPVNSASDVLVVSDLFDVPVSEKSQMKSAIE
jgi:hypothetical protein